MRCAALCFVACMSVASLLCAPRAILVDSDLFGVFSPHECSLSSCHITFSSGSVAMVALHNQCKYSHLLGIMCFIMRKNVVRRSMK